MSVSRYSRTIVLSGGSRLGTGRAHELIHTAIKNGSLPYREVVIKGYERLDTIAGEVYGDAEYWWILAASSDIGWGVQVPPGTIIKIPNINRALELVR